jgi:uncharacterized membrane protein YhaH (DUF805 family)
MAVESPTAVPHTAVAPLSQPLYGASFVEAVSRFFRKYATFSGRASRSELWWWVLAGSIVPMISYLVMMSGAAGATASADGQLSYGAAYWVGYALFIGWSLATAVPLLALYWRRLHDTNRSGAWYFIGFIPFVGAIILFVLVILPSDPAGARFDR